MTNRGDPEIHKKSGTGQSDDVHKYVVALNQNSETNRHGERLTKNTDSVSHDGQHRPALPENQRTGNGEHDRRARDRDNHERKRNERHDILQGDHTPSLSSAVPAVVRAIGGDQSR